MKKLIPIICIALLATSCSLLDTSFYDDNESLLGVEVRHEVSMLDCSMPYTLGIKTSIDKLHLYTESKKSKDIYKMVLAMKETSDLMAAKDSMSKAYCNVKKAVLEKQSKAITTAIMGRF